MFKSIALQFRFPRLSLVPPVIRRFKQQVRQGKTSLPAGEMILAPAEGVSPEMILADLEFQGYSLTEMHCEERRNADTPGHHYVIRFVFTIGKKPSQAFKKLVTPLLLELRGICNNALWRTRAYSNPLEKGARGMNIVLDGRKPFKQGDGTPVTVWVKDNAGERIGDAPLPLMANHLLRFTNLNEVPQLVNNQHLLRK